MVVAYCLRHYLKLRTIRKKIELSKFAYTTYQKVLVDLRSCLRGNEFNHTAFINEMKLIDELILDLCPLADTFEKQYDKKFK